jgi:hypothetical protein
MLCKNSMTATWLWIHLPTQEPAQPPSHSTRSSGSIASPLISRTRDAIAKGFTAHTPTAPGFQRPQRMAQAPPPRHQIIPSRTDFSRQARSTWARLIKKIFEAAPLLCSCGARMRIASFITDPRVVDRILRHLESGRSKAQDPFEPRAPPAAAATIRQ